MTPPPPLPPPSLPSLFSPAFYLRSPLSSLLSPSLTPLASLTTFLSCLHLPPFALLPFSFSPPRCFCLLDPFPQFLPSLPSFPPTCLGRNVRFSGAAELGVSSPTNRRLFPHLPCCLSIPAHRSPRMPCLPQPPALSPLVGCTDCQRLAKVLGFSEI
jgi:hypothetical protein